MEGEVANWKGFSAAGMDEVIIIKKVRG